MKFVICRVGDGKWVYFSKSVMLARGGSVTNEANPSSLDICDQHSYKLILDICEIETNLVMVDLAGLSAFAQNIGQKCFIPKIWKPKNQGMAKAELDK